MSEPDYNGLTGMPTATQADATGLLLPLFVGYQASDHSLRPPYAERELSVAAPKLAEDEAEERVASGERRMKALAEYTRQSPQLTLSRPLPSPIYRSSSSFSGKLPPHHHRSSRAVLTLSKNNPQAMLVHVS